jgi:hypothetical protein
MKYYKRTDKEGNTTTVESYNHDKPISGAIAITKAEYDDFIAGLPEPEPAPVGVTLDSQVQELKSQVEVLEQRIRALELAE